MFRNKIPVAEHELALTEANETNRANLVAFAKAAKIEGVEEKSDEELVTALTETIGTVATLTEENAEMNGQLVKAEKEFATQKEMLATQTNALAAANTKLDGVKALFGEKAKAEDFDVVEAVGSIVPEGFTASVVTEDLTAGIPADIKSPLDELNAEFQAGKITASQFHKKAMEL